MSTDSHSQSDSVDDVVAEYLRAIETGENPSHDELLARHPEFAEELGEFFADHDRMNRLAQPLCEATLANPAIAAAARIRYFGDYEVLDEIARGGMGVVFKARQITLNRIVAIKMILSGHLASPADVERFHTEAEAAAKLDHPGIVPIYEVGQHEGQHYFSMGFVDGISLSAKVAQGPLPARDAAELVRAVAEAAQYAHDKGVIHRDLKPGNILLDEQGRPRVTDFGLAKLTESHSDLTGTGQILGTPGYMPPEQAAGHVNAVGRLSDVYSLGAILYCLLTGRPPFQAATPLETLLQVQSQEPVPPRQLNPSIPLDLDTIVMKCLDKSPQRRFSSARAMFDELGRFLEGRPILARRIGPSERFWRWCRRNPLVAALVVLTVIFTAVLICGLITSNILIDAALTARTVALRNLELEEEKTKDALNEKSLALASRNTAFQDLQIEQNRTKEALLGEEKAVTAVTAANTVLTTQSKMLQERQLALYRSMLKLSHEQAFGNNILLADKNLESIPEELRGWEWKYAKRLCHADFLTMPGHRSVQFTSDGLHVVACINNRVEIRKLPDGEVQSVMKGHTGQVYRVVISRDGTRVASVATDNTIRVWLAESGELLTTLASSCRINDIAFSPNRQQIAGANADSEIRIWTIESGNLDHTFLGQGGSCECLAFSPNGESLVVGNAASITVWDTSTGQERSEFKNLITWSVGLEGKYNSSVGVAFSPNGESLAVANVDIVRLLDATTLRELKTFAGHVGGIHSVAFSPDGRLLATASSDGMVKLWDVDSGENRRTFPWHKGVVRSVVFAPGGRWLASATDSVIKIWDLSADWGVNKFPVHTDAAYALSFNRDGNLLVTGGGRYSRVGSNKNVGDKYGEVRVLDLTTNRVVFTKDLDFRTRFGVLAVALNSQGNKVAASGYIGTKVWKTETGEELLSLADKEATGETRSVCFSPDEKVLVTSNRSGARVWDGSSGDFVRSIGGEGFAQFSPDGTLLAVCSERLSVFDFVSGEQVSTGAFRAGKWGNGAWRLAFSPDGARIAVCLSQRGVAADEKIEFAVIFDTKTGRNVQSLKSAIKRDLADVDYRSNVYDVCFSPDGKRIATASSDKTVRIWDAQTGDELLLLDHPNQVFCVRFSPDGKRLASGSGHWDGPRVGEVRIWNSF